MIPIPQSRIEDLWNRVITGNSDNLPIPQSRMELLVTALITGDTSNLPIAQSRSEQLMHAILTNGEYAGSVQSRVEMFLKAILEVDIENLPTPLSRLEWYLDYIARNGCLEQYEYYPFTFSNGYLNVKNTARAKMRLLEMKGKTLVNIYPDSEVLECPSVTTWAHKKLNIKLKRNTMYTVVFTSKFDCKGYVHFRDSSNQYVSGAKITDFKSGINVISTVTTDTDNLNTFDQLTIYTDTYSNNVLSLSNIMVLEGDHTQNPPVYFQNMLSVGEDTENKVSILSANANLIPYWEHGTLDTQGNEVPSDSISRTPFIKVMSGSQVSVNKGVTSYKLDKHRKLIVREYMDGTAVLPSNCEYIRFIANDSSDRMLNYGTKMTYIPHQSNKASILFPHSMKGIDDTVCDRLVYLDDTTTPVAPEGPGTYIEKVMDKYILNENEKWGIMPLVAEGLENYISFSIPFPQGAITTPNSNNYIDNKGFTADIKNTVNIANATTRGLARHNNGNLYFRILKSDLLTADAEGFKKLLKQWNDEGDPCMLIYEVTEPTLTKISDYNLTSYDPETNVFIEGGAIMPETTIEIGTKIGAIVSSIKKEVRELQKQATDLKSTDVDLIATTWSMDDRIFEIEWILEDMEIPNTINLNTKEKYTMAGLSKFEQAKILILAGEYEREVMEKQLRKYESRGVITKEELDILISMMDAQELVQGE